jgi:DNA-binding NarL/FixJ family response regulator
MATLRILIADDHEVVRKGIKSVLEGHEGWQICGEAENGRDAVTKAQSLKPDIVILDVGMPVLNGLEATRQILKNRVSTKVLVLSVHETEQLVQQVLEAGAQGYLFKSDAGRDLVNAVDSLAQNKTFFTSKVAQFVLDTFLGKRSAPECGAATLTTREREVIQLLAEGNVTKEVAVALKLSVKTAETHRSNLMKKPDLHSMSELVLYAVRNNIVQVTNLPPSRDATPATPIPGTPRAYGDRSGA